MAAVLSTEKKLKHLNYMKSHAGSTSEKLMHTVHETERRQNLGGGGLTHVSDSTYQFFLNLEKIRRSYHTFKRTNIYRSKILFHSRNELLFNDVLKDAFSSVFDQFKSKDIDVVNDLFIKMVDRYIVVANNEFRKRLHAKFERKKTFKHRTNIYISGKKKKDKMDKDDTSTAGKDKPKSVRRKQVAKKLDKSKDGLDTAPEDNEKPKVVRRKRVAKKSNRKKDELNDANQILETSKKGRKRRGKKEMIETSGYIEVDTLVDKEERDHQMPETSKKGCKKKGKKERTETFSSIDADIHVDKEECDPEILATSTKNMRKGKHTKVTRKPRSKKRKHKLIEDVDNVMCPSCHVIINDETDMSICCDTCVRT